MPGLQEIGGYLPSQRYPSDHLAVVADLRFAQPGPRGTGSAAGAAAPVAGSGSHGAQSSGGEGGGSSRGEGGGSSCDGGRLLPAAMHNVGLAAEALARGEVIAVPTDTLYGGPPPP